MRVRECKRREHVQTRHICMHNNSPSTRWGLGTSSAPALPPLQNCSILVYLFYEEYMYFPSLG